MKNTLLEELQRIHTITYGKDILLEQEFVNKLLQSTGFQKIDEPKKADLISGNVNQFFETLEDAANSGGLFEQKVGSMEYQQGVEAMQIGLVLLGYDLPQYGVDGLFGPETATAVDRFKQSNNIPSDNTHATPETLKMIISQLRSRNVSTKDIQPHIDKVSTTIPIIGVGKGMMEFFINKGLSVEQSAGIIGNLYQESRLRPNARGDNGQAYGIAQWRDERLQNLQSKIRNWNTLEGQLKFLWLELSTTEKNALTQLLQTTTPQEAAAAFAKYYERPKSTNYRQRENLAQNIYIKYTENIT